MRVILPGQLTLINCVSSAVVSAGVADSVRRLQPEVHSWRFEDDDSRRTARMVRTT